MQDKNDFISIAFSGRCSFSISRPFKGDRYYEKYKDSKYSLGEIICQLNEHALKVLKRSDGEFQSEIETQIKQRLQPYTSEYSLKKDIKVITEIKFFSGSIQWTGTIAILNILAAVGGTIGLADYISRGIKYAIQKTVKLVISEEKRHFSEQFGLPPDISNRIETTIETDVEPPFFPASITTEQKNTDKDTESQGTSIQGQNYLLFSQFALNQVEKEVQNNKTLLLWIGTLSIVSIILSTIAIVMLIKT